MELELLYEDNHIIAVNKPNGVLVHEDRTGDPSMEDFVKEYLKVKYAKPGNVYTQSVHRLDRPVSGVLILAKTSKGKERMAALFKERKVKKTYWALSHAYPHEESGTIRQYLTKNRQRNIVSASDHPSEEAKYAETSFRLIGRGEPFYFFELHPVTGRPHQIRVMMKTIGSPILGDLKYGGEKINNPRAILLHCRQIEFEHPVKHVPVTITADLPNVQAWHTVRHLLPANSV